ncbi:hypothetical protein [Paraburkholderia sp. Ac-20347]|uniref:hypothetical protein n=1 Tax=Paraburkholderia sp. Ac-20347 TaxID=2703892 RepID=UPI0019814640|nr:hypothetical protein [Paraburkholderia sp. Ac-20347]MBN3810030.1 hypothetical protein [Paraburkholderia sp. Ac-20347]
MSSSRKEWINKETGTATAVSGGLFLLGWLGFINYQLARAAMFGVVYGIERKSQPWHEVFHATAPGEFRGVVELYLLLDLPAIAFALMVVIFVIKRIIARAK